MTRSISLMAAIGALGLVAPVAGQAKQPSGNAGSTPSSVTAAAAPNPVVDGYSVAITGKLAAKTAAGVSVTLTAAPYPYTTFAPVANTMTDSVGVYHFAPSPKLNTEYRVMAKSKPHSYQPDAARVRSHAGCLWCQHEHSQNRCSRQVHWLGHARS